MSSSILQSTLREMIQAYGLEILSDGPRVIAMFSDFAPLGKIEKRKLQLAYKCRIVEQLYACIGEADSTIACAKAISVLKDEEFMEASLATELVRDIADVLQLNYTLLHEETAPPPSEEYVSQPESSLPDWLQNRPPLPDTQKVAVPETRATEFDWVPGSGIGYSSHPPRPSGLGWFLHDMQEMYKMDQLLAQDKVPAADARAIARTFRRMGKIVKKWAKLKRQYNEYCLREMDGRSAKKVNYARMLDLEWKFWNQGGD